MEKQYSLSFHHIVCFPIIWVATIKQLLVVDMAEFSQAKKRRVMELDETVGKRGSNTKYFFFYGSNRIHYYLLFFSKV